MSNPLNDPLLYAMGKARLQSLLPKAREIVAKQRLTGIPQSGLPAAMAPYLNVENMEVLVVYPGLKGGWYADLYLKNVPTGVSNAIGTPVERPHVTLAEAEEFAVSLLAMALHLEQMVKDGKLKPRLPTFTYFGFAFDLRPELLTIMESNPHAAFADREAAYARLAEETAKLFPQGVTDEAIQALPRERMALLWTVMHRSAMTRVMAYPPRREAAPGKPATIHLKPGETIDDVDLS